MFLLCIQHHLFHGRTRIWLLGNTIGVVLWSVLLFVPAIPAVSDSNGSIVATVLAVVGENTFLHHEKSVKIAVGSVLYAGDIVTTKAKGKVTLLYIDGSQVCLNSNTRVAIDKPSQKNKGGKSLLSVVWGEIKAMLRPGRKIKTKSVAAGARGTEFVLSVDQENTATVKVIEGLVEFYNDYGKVEVGQSQQSTARLGAAPTAPVTVGNAGFIIEWTLDLDRAAIPRESPGSTTDSTVLLARIAELQKKVLTHPADAAARYDCGNALFDNRQYKEALVEFREADRHNGGQSAILTRIADTVAEQGDLNSSIDIYRQVLAMSPDYLPALIGNAYALMRNNRLLDAETSARQAVLINPNSAEAQIVLGLSLMRQQGKSGDAEKVFKSAMSSEPKEYRYQARSWLAVCSLYRNNRTDAVTDAESARQENGGSALVRGNLALVYLFSDRSADALREARAAVALNQSSVSAHVVLAQSLLDSGRLDSATTSAARAVALDPGLPQAYYVLGAADAQRRDYIHASRNLKKGLELAPDFLPLATILARVYLRMDRQPDAESLLSSLSEKYPGSHEVLSARAEMAYEEGNYSDAIQFYKSAIDKAPNIARYHAEMARALIYANMISDAILASQKAIALVPENSDFHSVLGQAYEYGGLDIQSDYAYRVALALDGQNAYALAKLGLRNQEGDSRTAGRTAGLTFAQGFMLDPAISHDLLRGGIDSEFVTGVQDGGDAESFTLHNRSDSGKTQLYARFKRNSSDGERSNSDYMTYTSRLDATFTPSAHSNAYGHAFYRSDNTGLPGQALAPVLDDRRKTKFGEYILGYRYRFGDRNRLWIGAFGNDQREEILNPNRDISLTLPGINLFGIPITTPSTRVNSDCQDVEIRLDMDMGKEKDHPSLLTLGAALPATRAWYTSSLLLESGHDPDPISDPDNTGILSERRSFRTTLAYLQWTQRTDARFRYTTQVRIQDVRSRFNRSFQELTGSVLSALGDLTISPPPVNKTRILPSFAVDYMPDTRMWLRLSASRRMTDITSSIFVPTETLLSTEEQTLPIGLPETTRTIQLDVQRYLAPGEFLKLFFFRSLAEQVYYEFGNYSGMMGLPLGNVRRTGMGVKYEKPLGSNLYGQLGFVGSSSRSKAPGTTWDEATAPYHSGQNAFARLNYIDSHGSKFGVDINYDGRFYQDTVDTLPGGRMTSRSTASVDISLAKENGVHSEFFLQVKNIFNTRRIIFNDVPYGQRTWVAGWTHRQ